MRRTPSIALIAALTGPLWSCGEATPDGEDCSNTFCGCWTETTLEYQATVIDPQTGAPLAGIELFCDQETTPISTSDAAGRIDFSIQTGESPGCGYARCNNLTFHDPHGTFIDQQTTPYVSNGGTVVMQYGQD